MTHAKLDLNLDGFEPYVSFLTGHTQTVLGHVLPSAHINFALHAEVLDLPDGDQLFVEYDDNKSDFTLSLYHGLAGDARSDYMRRSAILAKKIGWNVILVSHRGLNNTRARQTYHSGRGEDASAVIEWARKKFPGSKQVALGFSMSGSILMNLLTERYGETQPDFAVVVHAPLDLAKSARLLSQGLSKVYDYRFYLLLKKIIKEREQGQIKMPFLGKTMDIDEIYSSQVNGFKNALDYYEKCSTRDYVDRIKTKTFVLTAQDDPFVDVSDYLKAKWNENVHLIVQNYGGHMGYFARKNDPRYGHRWLDHYLESVFLKIQNG